MTNPQRVPIGGRRRWGTQRRAPADLDAADPLTRKAAKASAKAAKREDRDAAKAAQEARSKKYHIGIKDGGNVTKPAEFADVPDADWGDPVNYAYPCHDKVHADDAAARWGDAANRDRYDADEQAIIGKRIAKAQAKFGESKDDDDQRALPAARTIAKRAKRLAKQAQRQVLARDAQDRGTPGDRVARGPQDRPDGDAVAAAMQRLAAMPNVGGKNNRIAVPLPFAATEPYRVTDADFAGARHTRVDVAGLTATEPTVKRKKVAKFIQQDGAYSKLPRVVRVGDRDYLTNGHHRATAAVLLGLTKLPANVLTLRPEE